MHENLIICVPQHFNIKAGGAEIFQSLWYNLIIIVPAYIAHIHTNIYLNKFNTVLIFSFDPKADHS